MILFADFDRTLYFRNEDEKTDANVRAIQKWRAAGHQFCISTGRSYKSVSSQLPIIEELCDYYIVDGGSIILFGSGKVLQSFYFDPGIIPKIVEFSQTFPEIPIPFYYTPTSEGFDYEANNVTKLRLWFKDSNLILWGTEQIKDSFPVLAFAQEAVHKYKELEGYNGFVEILPIDCGKSHAVKFLVQKENIPVENIVTIGDGLNDHDMIRDFNGFAIDGYELSRFHPELHTTPSLASLIDALLKHAA